MAQIDGTAGADILIGSGIGTGDDTLRGLQGADTYRFSIGNGIDTVSEESGNASQALVDRLQFMDRSAATFYFSRAGVDLVINPGGLDRVTVAGQYDPANSTRRVEQLTDVNGIVYTLQTGLTCKAIRMSYLMSPTRGI
jgi:Ca2+-binding RTX toxin-like protein